MVRPSQPAEPINVLPRSDGYGPFPSFSTQAKPLPLDRAKQLTKRLEGDDALDTWAARMMRDAEDFQKNKRSDPLGGFLVTHSRQS